jgi:hypothetical protein
MSSLSTILVNRLVLNLRERAVKQLPTTFETAGRFQAALPVLRQPDSDIHSESFIYLTKHIDDDSDSDSDTETAASVPAEESPSRQIGAWI